MSLSLFTESLKKRHFKIASEADLQQLRDSSNVTSKEDQRFEKRLIALRKAPSNELLRGKRARLRELARLLPLDQEVRRRFCESLLAPRSTAASRHEFNKERLALLRFPRLTTELAQICEKKARVMPWQLSLLLALVGLGIFAFGSSLVLVRVRRASGTGKKALAPDSTVRPADARLAKVIGSPVVSWDMPDGIDKSELVNPLGPRPLIARLSKNFTLNLSRSSFTKRGYELSGTVQNSKKVISELQAKVCFRSKIDNSLSCGGAIDLKLKYPQLPGETAVFHYQESLWANIPPVADVELLPGKSLSLTDPAPLPADTPVKLMFDGAKAKIRLSQRALESFKGSHIRSSLVLANFGSRPIGGLAGRFMAGGLREGGEVTLVGPGDPPLEPSERRRVTPVVFSADLAASMSPKSASFVVTSLKFKSSGATIKPR